MGANPTYGLRVLENLCTGKSRFIGQVSENFTVANANITDHRVEALWYR